MEQSSKVSAAAAAAAAVDDDDDDSEYGHLTVAVAYTFAHSLAHSSISSSTIHHPTHYNNIMEYDDDDIGAYCARIVRRRQQQF